MPPVLPPAFIPVKPRSGAAAFASAAALSAAECAAFLARPLMIGALRVPNRVFSAPMSGVSDEPYQRRALEGGAGLVFAEMAAAAAGGNSRREKMRWPAAAKAAGGTQKGAVQLFGRDPALMAAAAKAAEEQGAALIDINMGCPAKKLALKYGKNGEAAACGAALMCDEGLALAIVEAVLAAVSRPVSVKMRLGWDSGSLNAPRLAAKAAEAGAAMITVHARTRAQFYNGKADWAAARAVREAISAPLIINGDIGDLPSAAAALCASGADGVMIGRAGCGQPWLAGQLAGHAPPQNIGAYVLAHCRAMQDCYGEARGLRHARKHIDMYLQKQAAGFYSAAERAELMTAREPRAAEAKLAEIFARLPPEAKISA